MCGCHSKPEKSVSNGYEWRVFVLNQGLKTRILYVIVYMHEKVGVFIGHMKGFHGYSQMVC